MNATTNKPDARPLYAQVKDLLKADIQSGRWKPGETLPNEFQLAEEFGVSQGTVRKALDALAAEQVIERRQGRGTFVARHTAATVHFRFFRIFDHEGQVQPDSREIQVRAGVSASAEERRTLDLPPKAQVVRIDRIRTHAGKPIIAERISLPETTFKAVAERAHVPNTLYDLYQTEFGVTVARVEEKLRATAADKKIAAQLGCAPGTPLLLIERTARDWSGNPIELRKSYCLTDSVHYQVELK